MITFHVEGMRCGRCVARIEQALTALDAQAEVRIDLGAGTVSVRSGRDADALRAVLDGLGYPARRADAPEAGR